MNKVLLVSAFAATALLAACGKPDQLFLSTDDQGETRVYARTPEPGMPVISKAETGPITVACPAGYHLEVVNVAATDNHPSFDRGFCRVNMGPEVPDTAVN